jgi:hypothetical protein
MKVSHGEGLANHTGPKSCVVVCKGKGEALIGVRTGPVLSREMDLLRGADAVEGCGRPHPRRCSGKALRDPARSQTRRMYASTLCGTREALRLSGRDEWAERIGKSQDVRR